MNLPPSIQQGRKEGTVEGVAAPGDVIDLRAFKDKIARLPTSSEARDVLLSLPDRMDRAQWESQKDLVYRLVVSLRG